MDVLSSGPERVRPRGRRWLTVGMAVVVAAAAVVLAARSTPHRRPAALAPTPTATLTTVTAAPPSVMSVGVGRGWAYALVAECLGSTRCSYELRRRELSGGRWFPTALRTSPKPADGRLPELFVDGDALAVVEEPNTGMVYFSADSGATVQARPMAGAGPVAAVRPDQLISLDLCDSCSARLTALDPSVSDLHPLATQPPLGTATLLGLDRRGDVLWLVAATARNVLVTAVSPDAGRSWRVVPLPGAPAGLTGLVLTAGPGGSAYLLASAGERTSLGRVRAAWRIDGPAEAWRRLPIRTGPPAASTAVPVGAALLFTDYLGFSWRLDPDGRLTRLPRAEVDGRPVCLDQLAVGPDGLVVGVPIGGDGPDVVLLSTDQGRTWAAERVTD